jgi:hypothetical protein
MENNKLAIRVSQAGVARQERVVVGAGLCKNTFMQRAKVHREDVGKARKDEVHRTGNW